MTESAIAIIVGAIAAVLALPPFLQWVQSVIRWQRRRDPLRIEVSPHRIDDRVLVTVANRGDRVLELGWGALLASDGTEPLLSQILPSSWDISGQRVGPLSEDDGHIFPLLREWMPPGVRWTGIHIFDKADHHRFERIPSALSKHLERME